MDEGKLKRLADALSGMGVFSGRLEGHRSSDSGVLGRSSAETLVNVASGGVVQNLDKDDELEAR